MQLESDQSVFKLYGSEKKIYLAIHVDDGLLICDDAKEMNKLLNNLKEDFEITVTANPKTYLGLKLERNNEGIHVSQPSNAEKVVKKFINENCKSQATPMVKVMTNQDIKTEEYPYRETVGSLLYLSTKTTIDITYAVNHASRSLIHPSDQDVINVKRTLRYLKGTLDKGISYSAKKEKDGIHLEEYCDADFAGDEENRKSTSGFIILLGGGPVSWSSKKQTVVAQSTTEAEYVSAAHCCQEMKYIKNLIEEMMDEEVKMTLYINNQSTVKMIKPGQTTRKSKYIDVKYHFIVDELRKNWFNLKWCETKQHLADILTKPLNNPVFSTLRDKLMV